MNDSVFQAYKVLDICSVGERIMGYLPVLGFRIT
jgi:hypothetical protein